MKINIRTGKEQMENLSFQRYCLALCASRTLVGINQHKRYKATNGKDIKMKNAINYSN